MTGAAPPAPKRLGDGTILVGGAHGDLRMSENGERWWNGRLWVKSAESTPWAALLSADGTTWWDGQTWRPRRRMLAWWQRHPQIIVIHLLLPLLVLVLVPLASVSTAVFLMVLVDVALYAGVISGSKVLDGGTRAALLFGIFGYAFLRAYRLLRRGGGPEDRLAVRTAA